MRSISAIAVVVKNPKTGEYFNIGSEEAFLLERFDGVQTPEDIRAAFAERFAQALTHDDLNDFIDLARRSGFLDEQLRPPTLQYHSPHTPVPAVKRQSVLYWRKRILDPDRLFNFLEPKIRFLWTSAFLVISLILIVFAGMIVWADRNQLVTNFPDPWSARTLLMSWLTIVIATTAHEFAHGLTCKHFGGEVHEIGFLLMYFTPCFYCNVSDAWLLPEKSRRLWITFAGGYCDLVLWALATFLWRATFQQTALNYIALLALSICGVRVFFNFNPLLKLDGYYLLSDWMEIPNLRRRSWQAVTAQLRRFLWGAPRPAREEKHRFLLGFGLLSWWYSMSLLAVMIGWLVHFLGTEYGIAGGIGAMALGVHVSKDMVDGFSHGEFRNMIHNRHLRTYSWLGGIALLAAALWLIHIDEYASGPFQLRPSSRMEVRATVSGFLGEVFADEGQRLTSKSPLLRLQVPDLASRIAQKQKESAELRAKISQDQTAQKYAQEELDRAERVFAQAALSKQEHEDIKKKRDLLKAEVLQSQAKLERITEEQNYLETSASKQLVICAIDGVVTTPHLKERIGQYFHEGDLICAIEDPERLQVEIKLPEEEAARVKPDQLVDLKMRALPFETFRAAVLRTAPIAAMEKGDLQSSLTVYCNLQRTTPEIRPGMTGSARIVCGHRPAAKVFGEKLARFFRTEFWW